MITEQPLLITTLKTYSQLYKNRIVSFTGVHTAVNPLGICAADTKASSYAPIITHGIALVETGEAVFAGEDIGPDSSGRAVPSPIFQYYLGRALDGALNAGALIRVILNVPKSQ
ncbi:MAG: DUF2190 family protein [Melioribacteraceae bacterium]|nr:DUF2190 family protein [Melioribacteraceae bacterium]